MEQKPSAQRPVKGKDNNLGTAFVLLILAVGFSFFMTLAVRQRILYSTLQETGMKIEGTVISTGSSRNQKTTTYSIKYEYTAPDGRHFIDSAQAGKSDYIHYSKGMKFDLYVSPTDPELNKPVFTPSPPLFIIIPFTLLAVVFAIGSVKFFLKHFQGNQDNQI